MSKLLNKFNNTTKTGMPGAPAIGQSMYEPSIPRVAFGFAAATMTVITLAVSVILPAQMDSGSRKAHLLASSKANAPASVSLATVTSIEVVGTREPGSSTVPVQIGESASHPGRLGKASSPAVVRVANSGH
jgi:hypothetical protein